MSRLVNYYSRRASEYDSIYQKPERQTDIAQLAEATTAALSNHSVLELACGTGFWTEKYAGSAASVLGLDASPEMLGVAAERLSTFSNVRLAEADVLNIPNHGLFSACFCGFFWSHILRENLPAFLNGIRPHLLPGATLSFADNRFVPGSNTEISRVDALGNTYQIRSLADGSRHEVLKNFPTPDDLHETLGLFVSELDIELFDYFWLATGRVP
jgi:demethylmenaquinone methyltransferase/2-methoxy-6-polyprenyl-1,4-benzoquinol methylase